MEKISKTIEKQTGFQTESLVIATTSAAAAAYTGDPKILGGGLALAGFTEIKGRGDEIKELHKIILERDEEIQSLKTQLRDKDIIINSLKQEITSKNSEIQTLKQNQNIK